MNYQEYIPSEALRDYVKCYYLYESDLTQTINDKAFATGCVEIMFNLHGAQWETQTRNGFTKTAKVEVWGQVIRPLALKLTGKSTMMGIRFHPYGAALFLNEELCLFNDLVIDLSSVLGKSVEALYDQLMNTSSTAERISLIESFLLKRLGQIQKKKDKTTLVKHVMHELTRDDFFDNIENVASRHGITSRYLQKIFVQQTGLTPKLYSKINRFQKSLVMIGKGDLPLTSVAYQSGYFDQSHFIREFRTFTGTIPSGFNAAASSAVLASPVKD